MSLTVGTNSWTTVAEADTFLADWVGTGSWYALDESPTAPGDESKETYLTTAYQWLKARYQLAASESAPDDLKRAQSYAADWLISAKEDYEKRDTLIASGVEEFTWSRWDEKLSKVAVPAYISDIMANLDVSGQNTMVQLKADDYTDEHL